MHAHGIHDIECDTTATSPYDCAMLIEDFLTRRATPTAFDRLRSVLLGSERPRGPAHTKIN